MDPDALPVGGTTGACHESSEAIGAAAQWLASLPEAQVPKPAVPALRRRFGLSAREACWAISEARLIRARSH